MDPSKDVFVALAAIAWADGKLASSERGALLEAARACGLDEATVTGIDATIATYVDLNDLARLTLRDEERAFVYGLALWLAGVDGVVDPSEQRVLEALRTLLGVTKDDESRGTKTRDLILALAGDKASRSVLTLAQNMGRVAKLEVAGTVRQR
jgi:tellurite resistance protein